jgi:hypothetical protein
MVCSHHIMNNSRDTAAIPHRTTLAAILNSRTSARRMCGSMHPKCPAKNLLPFSNHGSCGFGIGSESAFHCGLVAREPSRVHFQSGCAPARCLGHQLHVRPIAPASTFAYKIFLKMKTLRELTDSGASSMRASGCFCCR